MNHFKNLRLRLVTLLAVFLPQIIGPSRAGAAEAPANFTPEPAKDGASQARQCDVFSSFVTSLSLEAGAARGLSVIGSTEAHELALTSLSAGHVFATTVGADHWYRGNLELRIELLSGAQFSPSSSWLVAMNPHLRYNFAAGTRLVPFIDLSPGAMLTDIGRPDLGTRFEFDLQAGFGAHWFLRRGLALTVEARYIHISDANTGHPNHGVNSLLGLAGVTWFF